MNHAPRFLALLLSCLGLFTVASPAQVQFQPPQGTTATPTRSFASARVNSFSPKVGSQGIAIGQPISISFSMALDASTISSSSIAVSAGGSAIPATRTLSLSQRDVILDFPSNLPSLSEIVITIDGGILRSTSGRAIDGDDDGRLGGVGTYSFFTAAPLGQAPGMITGFVFASNGSPLLGAEITSVYFPATEGAPPLPVPSGISDATGYFQYQTVDITGVTTFLVQIRIPGFSEALRRVELMAGGSWRIRNAFLQPISPSVRVDAAVGATLSDPTGTVELIIPPGALMQSSDISLTILDSSQYIRDDLPEFVMDAGTFVDVGGVFGDETNMPVTMRVPNVNNLPVIDPNTGMPTRVPMGKIDHNTLEWMDLRDAYTGGGTAPDSYNGTVVSLPGGGTAIEFQLDHFCTVCTGLCLSTPQGILQTLQQAAEEAGNRDCSGAGDPSQEDGNSVVARRDGKLWKYLEVPGFIENGALVPLQFGYLSVAAHPSVTLNSNVSYETNRPVERTIFEYRIEGLEVAAAVDFSQNMVSPHTSYLWNGRNGLGALLPTGSYPLEIATKSLNAMVNVAVPDFFGGPPVSVFTNLTYPGLTEIRQTPFEGRVTVVNLQDSAYGAGWSFMPEARLHFDPDGCVVLVQRNADYVFFEPDATQPYLWISTPGESSTLTAVPTTGTYERTWGSGRKQIFSSAGRILSDSDRFGGAFVFGYTGDLLSSYTTPTGFQVNLLYDGSDKLMGLTDSAGRSSQFFVDANGDLTLYTDSEGRDQNFQYTDHRLELHQGPRGEASMYTYASGRVSQVELFDTNARSNVSMRTRLFDPSAVKTDIQTGLDAGLGTLVAPLPVIDEWRNEYTDGCGVVHSQTTNSNGKTIVDGDGLARETDYIYDNNGQVAMVTFPDNARIEYDYDGDGRMVEERRFDVLGALLTTRMNQFNGPFGEADQLMDEEGRTIGLTHDGSGNVLTVDLGGITTLTLEYNDANFPHRATRATQLGADRTEMTYDSHGNVASLTVFPDPVGQPLGITETYTPNLAGFPVQFVDRTMQTFGFAYDSFGRLTSVTDPESQVTMLSYGSSNLPELITFHDGSTLQYEYDGDDRLVRRTDQAGNHDSYSYDAEGRVTQVLNRSGETITYELDEVGDLIRKELPQEDITFYQYDVRRRMTSASNDNVTLDFTVDELGRLEALRTQMGSLLASQSILRIDHTLDYEFDLTGRVLSVDDGDVYDVDYTYNAKGELLTAQQNHHGDSWSFTHDSLGQPATISYPTSGISSTYSFGGAGRLSGIAHSTTPPVSSTANSYDGVSALLTGVLGLPAQTVSQAFTYKDGGALDTADYGAVLGEAQGNVTYTVGTANRLTTDGEFTYTFDDMGRMTQRAEISSTRVEDYTYDAEGHLLRIEESVDVLGVPTSVMVVEYGYDPLGRRVERIVNGVSTRMIYDRENLALEFDSRGYVEFAYLHRNRLDAPLSVHELTTDRTLYYHTDRLGSVIALSDDTGAVVQSYLYDEFGNLVSESDPSIVQAFGFSGRERDLESGLYYMRNRYYDPGTGRFVTEDPSGVGGGLNLYAYVNGDPVNNVDPYGLFPVKPDCLKETYDECVAESRAKLGPLEWFLNIFSTSRGAWDVDISRNKATMVAGAVGAAIQGVGLGLANQTPDQKFYEPGVNSPEALALKGLETFLINGPQGACMVHALATCGL